MKRLLFFLAALLFLLVVPAKANGRMIRFVFAPHTTLLPGDTLRVSADSLAVIAADTNTQGSAENKRLVAALLAFPIPFGITGLHRIYLGTSPWIPIVYFVTLGGCGMLPLLDFIFILTASDEELQTYANNSKVFMWVQ